MPLHRVNQQADYSKLRRIRFLSKLSNVALFAILAFLVIFVGVIIFFFNQIPSPDSLATRSYAASTKIYDRNGELLYDIFQDQNRTPVKLSDIPDTVKKATISIEDKDFYKHQGFSVTGILRSVFLLITHRKLKEAVRP